MCKSSTNGNVSSLDEISAVTNTHVSNTSKLCEDEIGWFGMLGRPRPSDSDAELCVDNLGCRNTSLSAPSVPQPSSSGMLASDCRAVCCSGGGSSRRRRSSRGLLCSGFMCDIISQESARLSSDDRESMTERTMEDATEDVDPTEVLSCFDEKTELSSDGLDSAAAVRQRKDVEDVVDPAEVLACVGHVDTGGNASFTSRDCILEVNSSVVSSPPCSCPSSGSVGMLPKDIRESVLMRSKRKEVNNDGKH